MVSARDNQIVEFNETIEKLQAEVAKLNKQSNMDVTAQKEEMRTELESLKQRVLEELKQKSAQLEKEADDLEKERTALEGLLKTKEEEFAKHV